LTGPATTLSIEGLEICATRHGREVRLVDGLSLTLQQGEILALVGGSGSGKSMTCAGAQDALPPGVYRRAGRVLVDGGSVEPSILRGRTVATVLQNPRSAFNPLRTILDHACEVRRVAGADPAGDRQAVISALAEVGLEEPERVVSLYPFEMSGGMLQRAMIAVALLSGAPFLFADEPTTDLDLVVQARILALIEGLVAMRGLGVLLVTHDMGVVARLADRVAVMEHGRVIETGTVEDIFAAPQNAMTRDLVKAHLALYGEVAA
jgi:nickel transport system ATP-binding protein